jgi:hypothetical protein
MRSVFLVGAIISAVMCFGFGLVALMTGGDCPTWYYYAIMVSLSLASACLSIYSSWEAIKM